MNRNTLYDDKVRQLCGEKAAVGNYGQWLQLLVDYYKKAAKEIIDMGFNGGLVDLEMEVVQPQQVIDNEDEGK